MYNIQLAGLIYCIHFKTKYCNSEYMNNKPAVYSSIALLNKRNKEQKHAGNVALAACSFNL